MISTSLVVLLIVVLLAVAGISLIRAAARRTPGRACRAPGCDHRNRGDAKFCAQCGAPLTDDE
jgi:hypothetical protein